MSRATRTSEAELYQELAAEVSPCGWVGRKNLHIVARRGNRLPAELAKVKRNSCVLYLLRLTLPIGFSSIAVDFCGLKWSQTPSCGAIMPRKSMTKGDSRFPMPSGW